MKREGMCLMKEREGERDCFCMLVWEICVVFKTLNANLKKVNIEIEWYYYTCADCLKEWLSKRLYLST